MSGWPRTIIKWLPGGIAAAIMWASGVGPNEARSNVAQWLEFLGLSDLPNWLVSKTADRWIFWVTAVLLVSYVLLVFLRDQENKRKPAADVGFRLTFTPDRAPWYEDRTNIDGTICGRIGVSGLTPDANSDAELVETQPPAGLFRVPLEWMRNDPARGFVNVAASGGGQLFITHNTQIPKKLPPGRYTLAVKVTVKGQTQIKKIRVGLENGRLQMWE